MPSAAAQPAPLPQNEESGAPRSTPLTQGFRRRQRFLFQCSILAELVACLGGLLIAWELRSLAVGSSPINAITVEVCLGFIALTMIGSAAVRWTAHTVTAPSLAMGSAAGAAVVVYTTLFLVRSVGDGTSRPQLLLLTILVLAMLGVGHQSAREFLPRLGIRQPRYIAIVGDQQRAARLLAHLAPAAGWSVIASLTDVSRSPVQLEQDLAEFREKLRSGPVDEVLLVATVAGPGPQAVRIYQEATRLCEVAGIKLHVVADWINNYREVGIDHLGEQPLLTFSFAANSPWMHLLKRIIDAGLAAGLLVLLSPVLLLAMFVVKLDSPGPVLFRQTRCGLRGRHFTIYKLRSMVRNAESLKSALMGANELDGPVFKIARDPRITRVGRWLRRSSLDELPQLWNVLLGHMSLVGPRPPTPDEVDQYPLSSMQRLSMKPGITGLWQVSGRSSLRDFNRWVELDAEYIRNWSLLLDLKILARTLLVVARMTGT